MFVGDIIALALESEFEYTIQMYESKSNVPLGPVKPIYMHDNHFQYDVPRCHPNVAAPSKIIEQTE